MTRQNVLLCLVFIFFAIVSASVEADEAKISAKDTIGGLTCFSITPPTGEYTSSDVQKAKSCKSFCAEQGAACSGVMNGALNPPTKCEDPAPPHMTVCRCCKVQP